VEVLVRLDIASLEQLSGRASDFAAFVDFDIEEHPDLNIYMASIHQM